MTFEEYQKLSRKTAVYPVVGEKFVYPALGLAGEAGEVEEIAKSNLEKLLSRVERDGIHGSGDNR